MGLAGLLCALLTVASLSLLLGDYTVRKHGYDQRDQAGQTRAGKRPKLSAPPTPLSVLARGLEMHNGRLLFITWSQPRRQPGAAVMDQGDPNPLFEIFQAPDLVHIVQYILSLLALLAAYDAICGERLRGTLALVFTGPLRRGVFIAGKALGVLLGQLAIFLPTLRGGRRLAGADTRVGACRGRLVADRRGDGLFAALYGNFRTHGIVGFGAIRSAVQCIVVAAGVMGGLGYRLVQPFAFYRALARALSGGRRDRNAKVRIAAGRF